MVRNASYVQRKRIYERDKGICGICHRPVAFDDMDADHIVPFGQGGRTRDDNLRATHRSCNRSWSNGMRDVIIKISLTERLQIQFAADRAGLSPNEWIRQRIFED